ncbi:MAG: alanine--tRNA ligase [Proteobacteria bacterium]|nr:alanine--tRNA ligase [Pseudomonadota bacterium]
MSGVNDIRSTFLDFFGKNGHSLVPSSSLVPRNDPTLMFTSAGMVQFKNLFTGVETRNYTRAATSQKCLRAGGKHNDLDNVGYTARHHTFFEMLGNFSFGDYFKEEAIHYAWTLVTREYQLPKEKLVVTVYHDDDEAFGLWKKIAGLPDEKIIRIATSDNFWSMGDTGPCGPCSEIFYDHGPQIQGGPPGSADADGDRFIEIWNLVFMQYEQLASGERIALPRPSIDTGMGLERISAVLQGTHDNYETDMMRALIQAVEDMVSVRSEGAQKASHRVIADHLRAASFLVADGVLPSNEGRGYVARRIMRRGMRHAQLLGAKDPLMHRLVPVLVREMGQAYPELLRAEALISETLLLEEKRFRKTLERGLALLENEAAPLVAGQKLAGETAFRLYDTYGFPLDLTQDALRARQIGVDTDGFNAAMARQKEEARAAWAGSGEAANETIWFGVKDSVGATEFLGYSTTTAEAMVSAIVHEGALVDRAGEGKAALVFNQTPFYGESGGQVGDRGVIRGEGFTFRVTDTQKKLGDLFVHHGVVEQGTVTVGAAATLAVDTARRNEIRANHSATHLLHEALRQVLGDHVAQKGSLVEPDRLRFDISHPKPITLEELEAVEEMANAAILRNEPVVTRLMGVEEAMESGARALFGEKYGDEVRVVSMGSIDTAEGAKPYSVELCGGTHVERTGDIGLVSILGEGAVAAGVRRIEAMTGNGARRHLNSERQRIRTIASTLKVGVEDVATRVGAIAEERRRFEKELGEARKKLALGGGAGEQDASELINGVRFVGKQVDGVEAKDLKGLVDQQKAKIGSGIVAMLAVGEDQRAGIVVGVTEDLVARFSAVDLVRAASEVLGGKGGGGRPDMAQAGGPDGARAPDAVAAIAARIAAAG